MAKWTVTGMTRDTGARVTFDIDAPDQDAAVRLAGETAHVTEVREVETLAYARPIPLEVPAVPIPPHDPYASNGSTFIVFGIVAYVIGGLMFLAGMAQGYGTHTRFHDNTALGAAANGIEVTADKIDATRMTLAGGLIIIAGTVLHVGGTIVGCTNRLGRNREKSG